MSPAQAIGTGPARPEYQSTESGRDSSFDINVTAGKSVVVDCPRPVQRVAIGLGDYAEATAISPTEILLNGKTLGETSMIIWEVDGTRRFYNITVRSTANPTDDHLDGLRRELQTELPDQPLKVSAAGGSIFLRGTVKDINSSDRAFQIASTAGKVVNLLYVKVPASDPQILLKVRFASIDRSKSKQLGINFFSTGFGNVIGGVNTGQFSPPTISTPNKSTGSGASFTNELNMLAFFPGLNMGATIEALESKGVVEVLAQPNLLAANGKQASFLAGGEYPFPIVQGSGSGQVAVTIQFKEYGVRLNFIPTVTPRGTIRLQVAPEVSSLDFTNAVQISGFEVPAINTRKVKTEVELADGQSFAIGGLLDNRETETFEKLPFLGSIPVLGKLFQSISKTHTNTELIVIVTPEVVDPIPAGAPLPELKYPKAFMETNSNIPMHTPDAKAPGSTPPQAPPTMPIEQLMDSMKPEKGLEIDSKGYSSSGGGSSSSSGPQ